MDAIGEHVNEGTCCGRWSMHLGGLEDDPTPRSASPILHPLRASCLDEARLPPYCNSSFQTMLVQGGHIGLELGVEASIGGSLRTYLIADHLAVNLKTPFSSSRVQDDLSAEHLMKCVSEGHVSGSAMARGRCSEGG